MDLAYGLFMAEAEGYLDTREGKLQRAVNQFVDYYRRGYDIDSPCIQRKVWEITNLGQLTDRELLKIKIAVQNRI